MSELGGIEKPLPSAAPQPCGTTLHTGRDEVTGVEFLLTVFEDGLMTIATRSDVGATWSPPHVLAERTGEATS